MQKRNLTDLITYNSEKPVPKVMFNKPGYRMVLLSLRAGQVIPEHANREMVTVYAISGHITFFADHRACDLWAGEVLWLESGVPHRLEAHEDSALLVLAAGDTGSPRDEGKEEVLDLREVSRPQRHSLVFQRFDGLAVDESFVLINDHDPVPLNRQLDTMRPAEMGWEYISRGPESFRIRVRRLACPAPRESAASKSPATLLQGNCKG